MDKQFGDVTVAIGDDFVATVEIHRPPDNFFDVTLIRSLADAYEALDDDGGCRAIVLCSEGKHFCAGAKLTGPPRTGPPVTAPHAAGPQGTAPHAAGPQGTAPGAAGPHGTAPDPAGPQPDTSRPLAGGTTPLYQEAARLFEAKTPVVAAVQGAAIGGGLGLACSADFRVGCPQARFAANFARLGFHHGFGLSVTLPGIVGQQHALDMLYTGRRVPGDEAGRMGLCDQVVDASELRPAAHALAAEIARSAPLAVRSIRATMRGHLADQIRAATQREASEQERLRATADWSEGVRASAQRRPPRFEGR